MKRYVIIAGVNGAGKSTLYRTINSFQNMNRVNTDEIVREIGSWKNMDNLLQAGKIAVRKIAEYFDEGSSFNQETTLCGNSIIRNIDKAISLGYRVELHYVGLESVDIAKDRIDYRVSHGGHGIPATDVERRYIESFNQLARVIHKCDLAVLYDNSVNFKRFAIFEQGKIVGLEKEIPTWFKRLNLIP